MKKLITLRKEYFGYLIHINPEPHYHLASEGEICSYLDNMETGKVVSVPENLSSFLSNLTQNNIRSEEYEIRVLRHELSDRISAPLDIYFDYTNVCNLKCPPCYNMEHLNTHTMEKDQIKRIMDDMYSLGIQRIHLAGGEPTIYLENFLFYLDQAKRNSIVTSVATNGTLIDKDLSEEMLSRDLFAVSVSIDGYDEKSNEKIRGSGNFDRAIEGVRNLVATKRELNVDTDICLKPMYTPDTTKEYMEKLVELALELEVDKLKFSNPERSIYHEKGYFSDIKHKYYSLQVDIQNLIEKYKKHIKIDLVNNPFNYCTSVGIENLSGCIGAQELLTINPDGSLTPCLMNRYPLGNYFDYPSLKDFYSGSMELKKYLNSIVSAECDDCNLHQYCRGGCQVRKMVDFERMDTADPICPMKGEIGCSDLLKESLNRAREKERDSKVAVLHSL